MHFHGLPFNWFCSSKMPVLLSWLENSSVPVLSKLRPQSWQWARTWEASTFTWHVSFKLTLYQVLLSCEMLYFLFRVPEQNWKGWGSVKSGIKSWGIAAWRREPPWWPTAWSTRMRNFELEPENIGVSTVWRTQRLRSFLGNKKAIKASRHWGRLRTGMAKLLWTLIVSYRQG